MTDAPPDLRALFPLGARVVMTAAARARGVYGHADSWAGTVAGYSRDGTGLRVSRLGRRGVEAYHFSFWQLVDPPAPKA